MAFQEAVKEISAVYVVGHDSRVEEWLDSSFHPIPTLVVSVDMHLRIKTSIDSHLDLQPREAVIIRPGALHQHIKSRHLGMSYTQGFLESYSDFRLTDDEEQYQGSAERQPLWDMIHQVMDDPDPEQRCLGLTHFLQSVDGDGLLQSSPEHPAAGQMHEYIRLNTQKDISIEDIIAVSGLAEAQAFAVYKESYGLSPMQHLLKRRVYLAQAYMRSGMRLAEVADKSGFQSSRQMNRAFHRFLDQSPRSWLHDFRNGKTKDGSLS